MPPDRYEPLPGVTALPAWLWRRMSHAARVALLAAIVAGAVVVFSAARESRDAADAADAADRRAHGRRAAARARPGAASRPLRVHRGHVRGRIAVTSEVDTTAAVQGATLGHPYRALLDFSTGRYAFCKIAGRVDIVPDPRVVTPRECGG